MAEYTVKAPDGKTITLQGPDGASQDEIIAQAQALYKPQAAPKPAVARPATRKAAAPNPFLEKYNTLRSGLVANVKPEQRDYALRRFDSDPRAQKLRQLAGLAPLSTRQQEVRAVAKKSAAERYREAGAKVGKNASRLQSIIAGASRGWLFGLPQHLQAAALSVLPDELTGIPQDASYGNILQTIQGRDEAAVSANLKSGLGSEIVGALGSAGPMGGLIKTVGARLAASGAPLLARTGNILQELGTFRKGQKLANTGKIALIGGTTGAAQAAGTGGDVVEGAAVGTVAAPVVAGGLKTIGVLTRPARDFLRASTANAILKRFTTATRDEIEQAAVRYRTNNPGEEPTLYELLPLRDQENLRGLVSRLPARARERLAGLANERMADISQGFGRQVAGRTTDRGVRDANNLAMRLAQSRGDTVPTGEEIALAQRAIVDPTDMRTLARQEARNIMQPHDNLPVAAHFDELLPDANPVTGAQADDQAAEAIRGAAGPIRRREGVAGVTVQDVTEMLSNLRSNDNLPAGVRERAIAHLENVLEQRVPEAAEAATRMREQFASAMRIREGAKAGRKTQLREDVADDSDAAFQRKLNAYDTPEGAIGRGTGQSYALQRNAAESPASALRQIDEIAESPATQEAITRNLPEEAAAIIRSARDQREAARALSNLLDPKRMGADPQSAGSESIATMLAGLSPHAMAYTRLRAVSALTRLAKGIPEGRARIIVDMLFSRDPAMMQRAFRAIGNESSGAKFTKYLAGLIGMESGMQRDVQLDASPIADIEDDLNSLEGDQSEVRAPDVGDSPYGEVLQNVYATENPDLIELVQRVKQQESGGDQSAVSSAGAIGIMQVMPDTAPEAARLAGLPWDENAYYNDPAYNELLGIAYLSEQLRKYDGDVERALAAYNAGPGAVDDALSMHDANWLSAMPAETQDYVARVA